MKVKLDRARYGGATEGTAADGARFAVSFAIPTEVVDVCAADVGHETELLQVVEASPDRVSPRCEHFEICGGCQYQHIAYPAQARLKADILRDLLDGALPSPLPAIAIHTGEPWGYRNRIQLRIASIDGTLRCGYSRRGSNEFLPVAMCPIAAPVLWRSAEALMKLAGTDPLCARWLQSTAEVEIFTTPDESRVQMIFFLSDAEVAKQEPDGFAGFCERVKRLLPELAGASAEMDPELPRRVRRGWDGEQWGASGLACAAAGTRYWVSRGAFFQVNRFLVDELVRLVASGQTGKLAWDLYAGVGLFSRALADQFAEVVAVEGAEGSVQDLTALARSSKTGAIHPVHAATVDFLRERVLQRARPDLIVMDPPRAGVGVEGCELLARMKVRDLVYVSCDPVTLTRDLKVLAGAGYAVQELHMVDLFPHTFHMETVAKLRYTP